MLSFVSIASGHAEIIIFTVRKAFCNRMKCLQPVAAFPDSILSLPDGLLNPVFSHQAAQYGCIGLQIIVIIFQLSSQLLHTLSLKQGFCSAIQVSVYLALLGKAASGVGSRIGKQLDPVQMNPAVMCIDVIFICPCKRFCRHIKIYPFDIILLHLICQGRKKGKWPLLRVQANCGKAHDRHQLQQDKPSQDFGFYHEFPDYFSY